MKGKTWRRWLLMLVMVVMMLTVFVRVAAANRGDAVVRDEAEHQLRRVLNAISDGVEFMARDVIGVNLDGVIGVRLVEGQLGVLEKRVLSDPLRMSMATLRLLEELRRRADTIATRGTNIVKQTQPEYFSTIGGILSGGFWSVDASSRNTNDRLLVEPLVPGEAIRESDSDACLREILGTQENGAGQCQITEPCWTIMTLPGYKGYSLTHEVFYLQIAEANGCFNSEKKFVSRSLIHGFCSNILEEAESLYAADLPERHRDLFMEQAALCGMSGYRDFFRSEWLDIILSWQRQNEGCWGLPLQQPGSKQKREERVLPGGCEYHRTAVALGALVQYVRYLVEFMQQYQF